METPRRIPSEIKLRSTPLLKPGKAAHRSKLLCHGRLTKPLLKRVATKCRSQRLLWKVRPKEGRSGVFDRCRCSSVEAECSSVHGRTHKSMRLTPIGTNADIDFQRYHEFRGILHALANALPHDIDGVRAHFEYQFVVDLHQHVRVVVTGV